MESEPKLLVAGGGILSEFDIDRRLTASDVKKSRLRADRFENHREYEATAGSPKVNSFFAGIGGFDLGFQRAGFRPNFHCEIDSFCNSVLRRHWPGVAADTDIRSLRPEAIPAADIWCGGFPCQDVSVARGWLGRDGLKGANTGLFFPFAALVEACKPQVVVLENVTGLLNSHGGLDFASVLATFRSMGYGVAWRVLNTRYFGAPQSRPRVYVCAWRGSAIKAFNVLFEPGKTEQPEHPRLGFLRPATCESTGAQVPEVAYCLAATSGRHTGTDWSRSYVSYPSRVRRLTPNECERLQGFPTDWTLPEQAFRLADDEIDSLRYRALGNAVSVPVVQWVARRVAHELTHSRGANCADETWDQVRYVGQRVPDFSLKKATWIELAEQMPELARSVKWQTGGVVGPDWCMTAQVSSMPMAVSAASFVAVLDDHVNGCTPAPDYFLSPNAATGILRRVESQKRELFRPLHSALERLSAGGSIEASAAG